MKKTFTVTCFYEKEGSEGDPSNLVLSTPCEFEYPTSPAWAASPLGLLDSRSPLSREDNHATRGGFRDSLSGVRQPAFETSYQCWSMEKTPERDAVGGES